MKLQLKRTFVPLAAMALAMGSAVALPLHSQGKNPYAGDVKVAKLGEFEFRANCAFCHGLGARGGGRGPDLTRTPKKHGDSDTEIFNTINNGVPGTAMPPNGATQQGVGMTEEEIWQVVTYIRSVEKKPAMVNGDTKRGRELWRLQEALEARRREAQHDLSECDRRFEHRLSGDGNHGKRWKGWSRFDGGGNGAFDGIPGGVDEKSEPQTGAGTY